jgi:uncharacterized Zn-binding protein involved in type VI secretion
MPGPLLAAARLTDNHPCPAHTGGPLVGPGAPTVLVEGRPLIVGGDRAVCVGPIDAMVTGSRTVRAHRKIAVRDTDLALHGGALVPPLSPTVFIGGPTAGAYLGNRDAALDTCAEAGLGRASGSTQQTYGNCGVEASRQVINRARANRGEPPLGEEDVLEDAIAHQEADRSAVDFEHGGTSIEGNQRTLTRNGVPSQVVPGGRDDDTVTRIAQATAEGRGVITEHEAGTLWDDDSDGGHAITVVGVQFDEHGRPSQVIANDTGRADQNCWVRYPADRFRDSLKPGGSMIITNDPIW